MTGDELKTLRQSWGMTQVELAARLGVTVDQVANWETGRREISERTMIQLTDIAKLRAIQEILDSG